MTDDERGIVKLVDPYDDYNDDDLDSAEEDAEFLCDLCRRYSDEPTECCENCDLFLCSRCWGPRVCDDLYVGWCNSCAG